METLQFCVENRFNMLISGGTDTGKTVALRKVLSLIPDEDRIITIEDVRELFPGQPNCVSLIADLSGDVRSTDQLLKASLRMRPDRLIVGEIRGKEAMTFLEAINTGHGGSITTIHTETPELSLDRLAIAASHSGIPMSYDNLRNYIGRTIDVIIQTGRHGAMRGISEIYRPKREDAV
jgi:type IV secretion system protein VirB11